MTRGEHRGRGRARTTRRRRPDRLGREATALRRRRRRLGGAWQRSSTTTGASSTTGSVVTRSSRFRPSAWVRFQSVANVGFASLARPATASNGRPRSGREAFECESLGLATVAEARAEFRWFQHLGHPIRDNGSIGHRLRSIGLADRLQCEQSRDESHSGAEEEPRPPVVLRSAPQGTTIAGPPADRCSQGAHRGGGDQTRFTPVSVAFSVRPGRASVTSSCSTTISPAFTVAR